MAIRIVQLGTPRYKDEGLRVGTVRRPPRGVPKEEFASRDYYDVWLPILAPSQPLVTMALASTDETSWKSFEKKYRTEMAKPDAARTLGLLVALSKQTNFSVGCYCENAERCHRSILASLFTEHGAEIRT